MNKQTTAVKIPQSLELSNLVLIKGEKKKDAPPGQ